MKSGLLLALFCCACASDLSSPLTAVAVTFDTTGQQFKLSQVRLNTLTSLRHLQGSSGNVTSGGQVLVQTSAIDQKTATVASLRTLFVKSQGSQVDLTWNSIGPVVYVEDFASLELLSTYYNLEKARALTATYGLPALPTQPIAAHASLENEKGLSPLAQGEIYYPPLAIFYPPDATPAAQVPAALNLGAVAHALGHQAVEEEVWGGAPVPPAELLGSGSAALAAKHLARSFAEGVADYLAVVISANDTWQLQSLTQDAPARTLDQSRCGTPDMLDALPVDDSQTPYDPYPLGTVLASSLYDEGSVTTQQNTARGLIAALPAIAAAASGGKSLSLADYLNAIAANSPADQQPDLCGIFINRFAAVGLRDTDLPACTAPVTHQECQ